MGKMDEYIRKQQTPVKVEIRIVEPEQWQWMGKLSPNQLKILCKLADGLADLNDEALKEN
jgi:hypothetical protein